MSLTLKMFLRPDGRWTELEMKNIRDEDAAWFKEHNIQVSAEDLGSRICLYADYGAKEEDDETPKEFIYIVPINQSCEDAMAHIRAEIMELMK